MRSKSEEGVREMYAALSELCSVLNSSLTLRLKELNIEALQWYALTVGILLRGIGSDTPRVELMRYGISWGFL